MNPGGPSRRRSRAGWRFLAALLAGLLPPGAAAGTQGGSEPASRTIRWDYRIVDDAFRFVLTAIPGAGSADALPVRTWTLSPYDGEAHAGGVRTLSVRHHLPSPASRDVLYVLEAVQPDGSRHSLAAARARGGPDEPLRLVTRIGCSAGRSPVLVSSGRVRFPLLATGPVPRGGAWRAPGEKTANSLAAPPRVKPEAPILTSSEPAPGTAGVELVAAHRPRRPGFCVAEPDSPPPESPVGTA